MLRGQTCQAADEVADWLGKILPFIGITYCIGVLMLLLSLCSCFPYSWPMTPVRVLYAAPQPVLSGLDTAGVGPFATNYTMVDESNV